MVGIGRLVSKRDGGNVREMNEGTAEYVKGFILSLNGGGSAINRDCPNATTPLCEWSL